MATSWLSRVLAPFFRRSVGRGRTRVYRRRYFPWVDLNRLLAARIRLEALEDRTVPTTYTVTNVLDSGAGSLRQAILDANANAGADTIAFSIGTGAQSIAPTSALPTITEAVTIDGTTQPGWLSAPIVEIRGDSAGSGVSGFTITSSGTTIHGLVINRFDSYGVKVSGSSATGNTISGSYIGTDVAGTAAKPNVSAGVAILSGAQNNTVGGTTAAARNVVSGNAGVGVLIQDTNTTGNVVKGNYIGTDVNGTADLGNGQDGVMIQNYASGNTVGGSTADARNVISGNDNNGIQIYGTDVKNNVVAGNYIGTDFAGTAKLGNTFRGIWVVSGPSNTTIGGTTTTPGTGAGNVISGNGLEGVVLQGAASNTIQGNLIGLNATGIAAIANSAGIYIDSASNTVGGNAAGAGNVISGNTNQGVKVTGSGATGNVIAGNYIGTNMDGTAAVANASGVELGGSSSGTRAGTDGDGTDDAAERNVISGNTNYGLFLLGTTNNRIAGNYIGTKASGVGAIANTGDAIYMQSTTGNVVGTDGSNDAFNANERNIIAGNSGRGVVLDGDNVVAGNWIGVDTAGAALGNDYGIQITGTGSRVGTNADGLADAEERNVISGSTYDGIIMSATGATVAGNYIGTDPTGLIARPNQRYGIQINSGGTGNTIGGTTAAARNVISGNTDAGIYVVGATTTANTIAGNYIGTDTYGETGVLAGAVARWRAEGDATDDVGGHDGTLENGATFATGRSGQAFSFDGVDDYVDVPSSPGNFAATDPFSVSAWINVSVLNGTDQGIVSRMGSNANGWMLRVTAGNRVRFSLASSGSHYRASDTVVLSPGVWYHVTGTWDGTTARTYLNGTLDSSPVNSGTLGTITGSRPFYIGKNSEVFGPFNGLIDEPAIYSRALSVGEIQSLAAGHSVVGNSNGVYLTSGASGNTIGGPTTASRNVISGNAGTANVYIENADGNTVRNNYVGTTDAGDASLGGGSDGVHIFNSNDTIVRDNLLSGNVQGLTITGGTTTGTQVAGNLIGLNAAGTAAVSNTVNGIWLVYADGNTIGGTTADDRNVISGNGAAGIRVESGANNNTILGNYVGTNADGNGAVPNATGILVANEATGTLIGGSTAGARNIISGNAGDGIALEGEDVAGNTIAGNYVGTDVTGMISVWNGGEGIVLVSDASQNTIGGASAADGNVISGNYYDGIGLFSGATLNLIRFNIIGPNKTGDAEPEFGGNGGNGITLNGAPNNEIRDNQIAGNWYEGVELYGSGTTGNVIAGNRIGTNAAGMVALPNYDSGVRIEEGASNNTIGGTDTADRNVISGNKTTGVTILGSTTSGNTVAGNYIGTNTDGDGLIAGTVSRYRAEGNAKDAVGGNHGTLQGGATFATGKVGQAFSLDGVNDSVTIPDSPTLTPNSISVEAWINPDTLSGDRWIVAKYDSSNPATQGVSWYLLMLDGGQLRFGVSQDAPGNIVRGIDTDLPVISTGTWQHVTGTFDLATQEIRIYVNGIAVPSSFYLDGDSTITSIYDSGTPVSIGAHSSAGGGGYWDGLIDEVGIYNRALTAYEVAANYAAGEAGRANAIGNVSNGVLLAGGTTGNTIGGSGAGAGNVISGNGRAATFTGGIWLADTGTTNNLIQGNFIGTNAAGSAAVGNAWDGVAAVSAASGNTVRGNIISGNGNAGIELNGPGQYVIERNYIGTDLDGTAALPNATFGVFVWSGSSGNKIGGTTAVARNVVSGNLAGGIILEGAGVGNTVAGNVVGLTQDLSAKLGNGAWGIGISQTPGAIVGGTVAAAANIVAGNSQGGIYVRGELSTGVTVRGNYSGTTPAGTAGLGNAYSGIYAGNWGVADDGPSGTVIRDNVSSGNGNYGIWLNGSGTTLTVVTGNRVGTTPDGTTALGNTLDGIRIDAGAQNNTIGGTSAGDQNTVSGNAGSGIVLTGSGVTGNIIAGNFVGTNSAGTAAVGNQYGVIVSTGAQSNVIGTDGNGITDAAEGNLISGNNASGIWFEEINTRFNRIAGNVIGLNAAQNAKLANNGYGILFRNGPSDNVVGTNGDGSGDAAEGNVVAGNNDHGILITTSSGTNFNSGNRIAGNYVGTTASGTAGLGNAGRGIALATRNTNSVIGTNGDGVSDALERNVVAGNQSFAGIQVSGTGTADNVVAGNFVGLAPNGTTVMGNTGFGIWVSGAFNTRVGTNADGTSDVLERNVVVGNTNAGVDVVGYSVTTLTAVDALIAGTVPRTTAAGTIAQADLADATLLAPGDWGFNNPAPGVGGDNFAVLAKGKLKVATGGDFTFALGGNDGGRLRIDGIDVVVDNTTHSFQRFFGTVNLAAGDHTFEWVGFEGVDVYGFELSVAVGGGKNAPVTSGNGWQVLGSATPHAEIQLDGSVSVTAYYPTEGTVVAGNYIGVRADGSTKGANGGSGIFLDRARGIQIGGADAAARNVISGNSGEGVFVSGGSDSRIQGNYVGTNAAGSAKVANGNHGIRIEARAARTIVGTDGDGTNDATEGNVISGNTYDGVTFWTGGGTDTVIAGNLIGTDATGTAAVNNGRYGVWVNTGGSGVNTGTRIGTDGDGVSDAVERNVISGNSSDGIRVSDSASRNTVIAGNTIGLALDGSAKLANANGITVHNSAADTRIGTNADGGSDALERNVVSGNTTFGIQVTGAGTDRTVVAGNYVGTNAAGTAAVANGNHGIAIYGGPDDTRVGTNGDGVNDTAERNVYAGNTYGILVEGVGTERTVIAGNWIGLNAAGTAAIPNGTGVIIRYGATDTRVGTDGSNDAFNANERNVISGNSGQGIYVISPTYTGQVAAGGATTDRTVIAGNWIGLNAAGTAAIPNTTQGIYAGNRVTNLRVGTDGNGIADDLERNVISGNAGAGIQVDGWAFYNLLVADQFIAGSIPQTTAAGTFAQADFYGSGSAGNWTYNNAFPGGGGTYFFMKSTGTFRVNTAGTYTFSIGGDDGSRLKIDGTAVITDDTGHGFTNFFGTVNLSAGDHTFEWVGFQGTGGTAFEMAVAVGGGMTAPVSNANGWKVIGDPTPHSEIALLGSISTTVYYPNPGNLSTTIAGNYIGTNPSGSAAIANSSVGIQLGNQAQGVRIGTDGSNDVYNANERNVISGNVSDGIRLTGINVSGNVIAGNYIGLDSAGSFAIGNGRFGVYNTLNTSNNRIGTNADGVADADERNVVSGNASDGVNFGGSGGGSTDNVVAGNYLGTNALGTAALPNGDSGVALWGTSTGNRIGTNADGVNDAAERNLISGNKHVGVWIDGANAAGNTVAGNWIGLTADGTAALPGNQQRGVILFDGANNNTIGGTTAAARNVISGHSEVGILLTKDDTLDGVTGTTSAHHNTVVGNYIGTDYTGTVVLGNDYGIRIELGANHNTIGGSTTGAGNLIGGNTSGGIFLGTSAGADANTIRGNAIGTNAAGTVLLGNLGPGITVQDTASNNVIGGPFLSDGNRIANNPIGISIAGAGAGGNSLRLNTVYDNGTNLSITGGGNNGLQPPAVAGAVTAANTTVFGSFQGTPATIYDVDLYSPDGNPANPDTKSFLGTAVVTTGADGKAEFAATIFGNLPFGTPIAVMFTSRLTGDSTALSKVAALDLVVIEGLPAVAVAEGTPITLTTRAADPGAGQSIAYDWRVTRNGIPYVNGTEATFTFTPDDEGTYLTTLDVSTSTGLHTSNVLSALTVFNRNPVVTIASAPASVATGQPIVVVANATDPGSADALSYEWKVKGVVVSNNPSKLAYTPPTAGVYTVELTVTDDDGGKGSVQIAVQAVGDTPAATIDVPTFGTEGTTLHAQADLSDVLNQDELTFVWTVTRDGAPFAAQSAVARPNFEFTPDDDGTYAIGLTVVSNGTPFPATTRIVYVTNVDPEARIGYDADANLVPDATPPASFRVGEAVPLFATVRDVGSADTHGFNWKIKDVQSGKISVSSGASFGFTPTRAGNYLVELSVTDDNGGVSRVSTDFTAEATGRTVTIDVPAGVLSEGSPVTLTSTIVPPPGGVPFKYDWKVTKDGEVVAALISGLTTSSVPLVFTPPDDGTYVATLAVTGDDGSYGEATPQVLSIVNVAPTVDLSQDTVGIAEGSPATFSATVTDPGLPAEVLTYLWKVNNVVQDGITGPTFVYTPRDEGSGTDTVRVEVSDGAALTAVETTLAVFNIAPTLQVQPNAGEIPPAEELFQYHLTSGIADPGVDDILTYAWSLTVYPAAGAPYTYAFGTDPMSSPTGPTFSFDPTIGGTYVVTLTSTDGDGDGGSATDVTSFLFGGAGNDTIVVTPDALEGGANEVIVFAGGGDDAIATTGVPFGVIVDGGAGDDSIYGGIGGDVLLPGEGKNVVYGGGGNDTIIGGGSDTIDGGAGNDTVVVHFSTVSITDTGDGIDTVDLSSVPFGVTLDLGLTSGEPQTVNGTESPGSTLSLTGNFEILKGTDYGDRVTLPSGATLFGGGGDDLVRIAAGATGVSAFGGDGVDHLQALTGSSNVTLFGGDGADVIEALAGSSTVTLFGGDGADLLQALAGSAGVTLFGGAGDDDLSVSGAAGATLFGGDGNDRMTITSGSNIAVVGGEADLPTAGSDVTLFGGSGDDAIEILGGIGVTAFGGDGADTLEILGGTGVTLFGGDGADLLAVEGSAAAATLFAGDGDDAIVIAGAASGITAFGGGGDDTLTVTTTGTGITLFGGDGADSISASSGADIAVEGGDGVDVLSVTGAARAVTLFGGAGNDVVSVHANQVTVAGEEGNDAITLLGGSAVTLFGGDGNDAIRIEGTATGVTAFGGAGDDAIAIEGLAAGVTAFGGDGDDAVLVTSAGADVTAFGGAGNDRLETQAATSGRVTLSGDDGDDTIIASAGSDVTLFGGAGDDTVVLDKAAGSNVTVFGGEGIDTVEILAGSAVTVFGGDGNDVLRVEGGTDVTLFGGTGDDAILVAGGSAVTVFGGEADDAITVSGGTNVTAFGGEADDTITVSGGTNVTAFGGEADDAITVTGGTSVTAFGGQGEDLLTVSGGTDVTAFGGEGDDEIVIVAGSNVTAFGGEADDTITVTDGSAATAVTLFGGDGDDAIVVRGGSGVTVFGGDGNDAITYDKADTSKAGATLFGGEGDDAIVIQAGSGVTAFGGAGNDSLTAGSGVGSDVTLVGETGNDTIRVDAGSDVTAFGGDGDDAVTIGGTTGTGVTVFGGAGNDVVSVTAGSNVTVNGEDGNDSLIAASGGGRNVTLFGGAGDDTIQVTAGSDVTAFGGSGDDVLTVDSTGSTVTLFGGSGDDSLTATGGRDVVLLGERGNDAVTTTGVSNITLFGGVGDDSLLAGGGLDVDVYGDDGDDRYQPLPSTQASRIRFKEIRTLGEGHDEAEKAGTGTDHVDHPSLGRETLDLSAFLSVVIDLSVLGSDENPLAGWQSLDAQTVLVLHGYFENVVGTAGADSILGSGFANEIVGGGGNDTLVGREGNDTLEGQAGDDSLVGGTGSDTYRFAETGLGTDAIVEADTVDSDTLDFAALAHGIVVDLGRAGPQTGADVTFVLPGDAALENVVGTALNDSIVGNARDNVLDGGPGNDTLAGQAGADTYRFAGADVGADALTESDTDSSADLLEFAGFLGGINLNLNRSGVQAFAGAGTSLDLTNADRFENVVGTGFPDKIVGNAGNNELTGGGGLDYLDGGVGNDVLRGGVGQTIYLDFTATQSWEWQYTPAQRQAVRDRMAADFGPFGYTVTLTPPAAGAFVTVAFNEGPAGGTSDAVDFRNLSLSGVATVNVTDLLGELAASLTAAGKSGVPTTAAGWTQPAWEPYVLDLSATIAAHEVGHYAGLRHGDAYGPLGTGVNSAAQAAKYYAVTPALQSDGKETKYHVMASPQSVGTTLADSAADTFFGAREAIKLAFADTGTTIREPQAAYNAHGSFASAVNLGRLYGLSVPNTIQSQTDPFFNQSLSVAAATVVGSIVRDGNPKSEDDFYSFQADANELFHFEVNSFNLTRVANAIDSILKVYDAHGNLLTSIDDEFETPDAVIVDWRAPQAGTYYLVVDTYATATVDQDVGAYELFLYRAGIGPNLGLGDTLVTGAGNDEVITSTGTDTVTIEADTVAVIRQTSLTKPLVVNTDNGDYTAYDSANNIVTVPEKKTTNAPVLDAVSLPPLFVEGTLADWQVAATDKDIATDSVDYIRYAVSAVPGAVDPFPSGLTVDAVTGKARWVPENEGTYQFRITATDASGLTDFEDLTATVQNAAPTAAVTGILDYAEGQTVQLGSKAADVGPLDVLGYLWSVTFGGVPYPLPGTVVTTNPAFSFVPTENGTYQVTLAVTDGKATTTDSKAVTVSNHAPVATLENPTGSYFEGTALSLSAHATDDGGDGDLTPLTWTVTRGSEVYTGSGKTVSFTPADNGTYEVVVTARDVDGASGTAKRSVIVNSTAPTAVLANGGPVGEGGSAFVSFDGATDASPADLTEGLRFSFALSADGLAKTYAAAGKDPSALIPIPDDGSYPIYGRVIDKDGDFTDYVTTVGVTNAAPVVFAPGAAARNEGALFAASGSFTDAGVLDQWTATVDYGDGSGVVPLALNPDKSFQLSHVFANEGKYTVVIRVSDGLAEGTASTTVTVGNVAPVVNPPATGNLFEGGTFAATGTFADDGSLDVLTATVDYGDGSGIVPLPVGANRSFVLNHTYPDSGAYTITIQVSDGSLTGVGTVPVTVGNVAPTAAFGNSGPIAEGSSVTVSFAAPFDPSFVDAAAGFRYSFALTAGGLAGTYASAGEAPSAPFPFADNGSYTVFGRIFDRDGGASDYTTTVLVSNVAPTASLGTPAGTLREGSAVTVAGSATDPSSTDTAAGFTYAWTVTKVHGAVTTPNFKTGTGHSVSFTPDDDGTYTVYLTATDKDGETGPPASKVVAISNVAPTTAFGNNGPVVAGTPVAVSFTGGTDQSPADVAGGLRYSIATTATGLAASYAAAGTATSTSYTYPESGTYVVFGRVFDKDGGATDYSTTVTIASPAVGVSVVGNLLYVVGSTAADYVSITPNGSSKTGSTGVKVTWTINGKSGNQTFTQSFVKVIADMAQGGADNFQMTDSLTVPARVTTGAGNDYIKTGAGHDSIVSGNGNDQLFPGEGNNRVTAGNGNVYVKAGAGHDSITCGDGNDTIDAGAGNNVVTLGNGNNYVSATTGNNTVTSGTGNTGVNLGAGNHVVTLGDGNGSVILGDGSSTVTAGAGNTYVKIGKGNSTVSLGDGNATVDLGNGNMTVTTGAGNGYVKVGTGTNAIVMGAGNNTVNAGNGANTVSLGKGNSYVSTGSGHDTVTFGDGTSSASTGDGNDVVVGAAGTYSFNGGAGNDLLVGGIGTHTLTGGTGNDILIDGTMQFVAGYSYRQMLTDWAAGVSPVTIRSNVALVTYSTATASYLSGGSGSDWFWYAPTSTVGNDRVKTGSGTELLN